MNNKEKMTTSLQESMAYMKAHMKPDTSFDVVYRVIDVGGRQACIYFIDGFCKDELMMKILQYFISLTPDNMPENAYEMSKKATPYVEVDLKDKWDDIIYNVLSGVFALFIDGYDRCVLIDSRTYPARSVSEPDKDKTLRGSKDGFVETVVFNTALIRRRIRSTELRMVMMNAGKSSQTDIVLCYMDNRVDHAFLEKVKKRIQNIKVDALTMNQESLAECLYQRKWFNPFPKFKFTERPDVAAAQVLEGDIVILVDNSPSAMIVPTSIFDIVEEADDYYFPPITGTYHLYYDANLSASDGESPVGSRQLSVYYAAGGVQHSVDRAVPHSGAGDRRIEAGGSQYAEYVKYPLKCDGGAGAWRVFRQQRLVQLRGHAVYGVRRHRQLHPAEL